MYNSDPETWTRAELEAWRQHPDTIALEAQIDAWAAERREREWHEAEQAQLRITRENEERERRQREELERKWQAECEQRNLARAREEAVRRREERAKHYGLKIGRVHFEQRGDHSIWRTDHKTRRMVHGLASTSTINSHKYSLDASGCRIDFPIPLLVSHEKFGSVGEIVLARRSPREVYIVAGLHDGNPAADYTWDLIQQCELKAFSGAAEPGSLTAVGSVLDVKFYGEWTLSEVSLCKQGANPDCLVEIFSPRRKIF
jgi:hypothetical protein